MDAATANERSHASFSGIVALISDGRRAALSQLLAERTSLMSDALLFAANSDELRRAVTSGSLVLIEGSRLGELAATGRVREVAPSGGQRPLCVELGNTIDTWLALLPATTRTAFQHALNDPRAWSVKRVAHAAGISPRQLVRHCRLTQGRVAPKDVLLAARLAAAQALACSPRALTNTELARACGWVDVRSFRAALRRADLASVAALRVICDGAASVSDIVARLQRSRA